MTFRSIPARVVNAARREEFYHWRVVAPDVLRDSKVVRRASMQGYREYAGIKVNRAN